METFPFVFTMEYTHNYLKVSGRVPFSIAWDIMQFAEGLGYTDLAPSESDEILHFKKSQELDDGKT